MKGHQVSGQFLRAARVPGRVPVDPVGNQVEHAADQPEGDRPTSSPADPRPNFAQTASTKSAARRRLSLRRRSTAAEIELSADAPVDAYLIHLTEGKAADELRAQNQPDRT